MRFAASPLMVAVALGLLAPSVLEVEEDGLEERAVADNDDVADLPPAPAPANEADR